jgi:hypothetical protein
MRETVNGTTVFSHCNILCIPALWQIKRLGFVYAEFKYQLWLFRLLLKRTRTSHNKSFLLADIVTLFKAHLLVVLII